MRCHCFPQTVNVYENKLYDQHAKVADEREITNVKKLVKIFIGVPQYLFYQINPTRMSDPQPQSKLDLHNKTVLFFSPKAYSWLHILSVFSQLTRSSSIKIIHL